MKYGLMILLALLCVITLSACSLTKDATITCKDGVCKLVIPAQEIPITAKPVATATPVPTVAPVVSAPVAVAPIALTAVKPPEK